MEALEESNQKLSKQPDLVDFLFGLKKYDRASIVNVGRKVLWKLYLEPPNERKLEQQKMIFQIVNAYGPRVLALAMAFGKVRARKLDGQTFIMFCHEYLNIKDTLSDKKHFNLEGQEISELLEKSKKIPSKYNILQTITNCCLDIWMARSMRTQFEPTGFSQEELSEAYRVFILWDIKNNGQCSNRCLELSDITAVQFFRSAFAIFAMGQNDSGLVNLNGETPQELLDVYGISMNTMRKVAKKVSMNELLFEAFYGKTFKETKPILQKYISPPFYRYPLIHCNVADYENIYIVPNPATCIRGLISSFYSMLRSKDLNDIGDAIEDHIYETLKVIYGEDKVIRIDQTGKDKKADILIRHQICDLIIEVKSSLAGGNRQQQATMSASSIVSAWERYYDIALKCSASFKKHKRSGDHLTIPMAIIAEHFIAEPASFIAFCDNTGIFTDLGIKGIEFQSWQRMTQALAKNSVDTFMQQLADKWSDPQATKERHILNFRSSSDTPSHNFEYLKDPSEELFPKRLFNEVKHDL